MCFYEVTVLQMVIKCEAFCCWTFCCFIENFCVCFYSKCSRMHRDDRLPKVAEYRQYKVSGVIGWQLCFVLCFVSILHCAAENAPFYFHNLSNCIRVWQFLKCCELATMATKLPTSPDQCLILHHEVQDVSVFVTTVVWAQVDSYRSDTLWCSDDCFGCKMCMKTILPLISDCIDAVMDSRPHFSRMLLQLINIPHWFLINVAHDILLWSTDWSLDIW